MKRYIVNSRDISQILWLLFNYPSEDIKEDSPSMILGHIMVEFACATLRGMWPVIIFFGFFLSNIYILGSGLLCLLFQQYLKSQLKQKRLTIFDEPPLFDLDTSDTPEETTPES